MEVTVIKTSMKKKIENRPISLNLIIKKIFVYSSASEHDRLTQTCPFAWKLNKTYKNSFNVCTTTKTALYFLKEKT